MNTSFENSAHPRRSFSGRFVGWLFSWRTLRRALVTLVVLFTLAALVVTEENWRGKRAWEKFKREWEAKGERFDRGAFEAKPVPDDQNFLMTPFFAPLFQSDLTSTPGEAKETNVLLARIQELDIYGGAGRGRTPSLGNFQQMKLTDLAEWQAFYRSNTNFPSTPQPQVPANDVLFTLGKFGPVLNELRQASHRPHAVFPTREDDNFEALIRYLSRLKAIALVVRLRSAAYLEAGQSDQALEDVKLSFRLAESVRSESLMITHLVRVAVLAISVNSVWEGLARDLWNDHQLVELQKLLGSINLLADYGQAMRGERAFGNDFMAKMRRGRVPGAEEAPDDTGIQAVKRLIQLAPRGWLYQNQLYINRIYQLRLLPLVDAEQHRVYPEQYAESDDPPEFKKTTPYNILARMLVPAVAKSAAKTAHAQCIFDQAAVACALERFRLGNGQYPETLEDLVPSFIEGIPHDLINGKPLVYRRTDGGQFVLYSVGWNQQDDDGVIVYTKGTTPVQNIEQSDWVWRYPGQN